jgi:hypothetical protein
MGRHNMTTNYYHSTSTTTCTSFLTACHDNDARRAIYNRDRAFNIETIQQPGTYGSQNRHFGGDFGEANGPIHTLAQTRNN